MTTSIFQNKHVRDAVDFIHRAFSLVFTSIIHLPVSSAVNKC